MSKNFIITAITLIVIGIGAGVAIFLTKGYSFSPKEGRIVGTGIISVTSLPDGASVYIDGHLSTATNTNIPSLPPKTYDIRIVKDGFIPWQKQVVVSEGLVSEIKATLFPALPTIYPLTYNGVASPTLSPDAEKLAFAVPFNSDFHIRQKGGIWVWTMTSVPISFARGAEPHQIAISSSDLDFTQAKIKFSPNSTQVLVSLGDEKNEASQKNYLLPVDRLTQTQDLKDITPMLSATLKEWEDEQKVKDIARLATISDLKIRQIASSAASINWSPDETKFMVSDGKNMKVYDLSSSERTSGQKVTPTPTQKTTLAGNKEYILPEALNYIWLPDSKHIILIGEDKVSVSEIDGGNISEIYAGKFENGFVFPWPDSSRLVISTSFNTPTALKPNLFGINLK